MNDQEIEVKYYISDLGRLEARLKELDARLSKPRILETNLRFDTQDGELRRAYQVLRLRQDSQARLTFKGPSEQRDGARLRQEIEFSVSDFAAARRLLNALGYQVSMTYEKYRTTYELDEVEITLDELPYGNFAELEGPDAERIQAVNRRLGLDWEARAPESYTAIFDRLRAERGLSFRDLTFANFKGIAINAAALHLQPADVK